jgi:chemotaxis protein methyltransferase WspC
MTTAMSQIERLLTREIGLDPASVGGASIEAAVRRRIRALGAADPTEYLGLVRSSRDELELLVDEVIVPETWFFRDREPFPVVAGFAASHWLPANPGRRLRVLCAPCATGEEPYSVAMALLDAGLAPSSFEIAAVDVSKTNVRKAGEGIFGAGSFRGEALSYRDRHFSPVGRSFGILPAVRTCVEFSRGNVLDPDFLRGEAPFQIVFCRNLLIYLVEPARRRLVSTLDRLLEPEGLLIVGHAELLPILTGRFLAAGPAASFTLRKPSPADGGRRLPDRPPAPRPGPWVRSRPVPPADRGSAPVEVAPLDRIRLLADRGRLDEAAAQCEAFVRSEASSAQGHFMMGVILEALLQFGRAEQEFGRAVYLEPNFAEALTHLGLLVQRRGDPRAARRFLDRAGRLDKPERRAR